MPPELDHRWRMRPQKMAALKEQQVFIYKHCDDISTDCTLAELITMMDEDIETFTIAYRNNKDITARDCRGKTLLHIAAGRGREDITGVLLADGADVSALDHAGNTPLHCCGHIETIESIVSYRGDIFARNYNGDTPLELMRRRGVEQSALRYLERLMRQESSSDDSSVPLLRVRPRTEIRSRALAHLKHIWLEFCIDVGAERLIALLMMGLCLSLYIAYVVTSFTKKIDTRIPIDIDSSKMEL